MTTEDTAMIDELTRLWDSELFTEFHNLFNASAPHPAVEGWKRAYTTMAADAEAFETEIFRLRNDLAKAEQLVCDFQAASMLEVGNQGGPCLVQPIHVENHVNELRAENARLRRNVADAMKYAGFGEKYPHARLPQLLLAESAKCRDQDNRDYWRFVAEKFTALADAALATPQDGGQS